MFRNFPFKAKQIFLNILNNCLNGNTLPEEWKKFNIITLLKPNRNPTSAESYRPIVLSACGLKILEIMIKNRLDWTLERNLTFSFHQAGFRKGRGIYNNIAFLTTFIQDAFLSSESVLAVFLDIKSAYDGVNIYKLYDKLHKLHIPIETNNLIFQIMKNRLIYTRGNNGAMLGPFLATKGLPQGSPLSTILFNVYIADLFKLQLGQTKIIGYADDLVVFCSGTNINNMVSIINQSLRKINNFLQENDLSLETSKSEAIWFTKGKRITIPPPINLNNNNIEYKKEVKYLGIILQKNLKWNSHIQNISIKAKKSINILRVLSRVWWGADPSILMIAFQALVRSHLDFGSIFIKPTNKKLLNDMDVIFYQGLRACLGCMNSTPRAALLGEAAMIPLEQRRKILASKFLSKIVIIENHPLIFLIRKLRLQLLYRPHLVRNEQIPYIVFALGDFLPHFNKLYKSTNLPCYENDYDSLINPIKIIKIN